MLNPEITVINLTPHAIVLRDQNGVDTTFPPSGQVARCLTYDENEFLATEALGLPVVKVITGPVDGLPEAKNCSHKVYLVSSMVAQHPSIAGYRLLPSPVRSRNWCWWSRKTK